MRRYSASLLVQEGGFHQLVAEFNKGGGIPRASLAQEVAVVVTNAMAAFSQVCLKSATPAVRSLVRCRETLRTITMVMLVFTRRRKRLWPFLVLGRLLLETVSCASHTRLDVYVSGVIRAARPSWSQSARNPPSCVCFSDSAAFSFLRGTCRVAFG